MGQHINQAITLLASRQPLYYTGEHTGQRLTHAHGLEDASTWADCLNIGMEHGCFNLSGLDDYLRGLSEGCARRGRARVPVIVETPVEGRDEPTIRYNAWQFRQILARGVDGIFLCQAESADAVRAFVESCRYPIHRAGVGHGLGVGTRGKGGEASAAAIWGISSEAYLDRADPWPLNPDGELLLGIKIESPDGLSNVEQIMRVPGIAFAEMGPNDLGLTLGYKKITRDPYPPELEAARERIFRACRENGLAFLETCSPASVARRLDEGVRIVAGGAETAQAGRAHTSGPATVLPLATARG